MSDRLLLSTRKGLFVLAKNTTGWVVQRVAFLGENVTLAHMDHSGNWYVALNLGHFGVKLKFSADAGESWEDRAVPEYPAGETVATADGKPPSTASLKLIWALESGGLDQPDRLWAGTAPGGLFRSDDGGRTWELNRSLWDRPERAYWFGGGYEYPAIHSLCRDPRDSRRVLLALSCGGVWITNDDGKSWTNGGKGLFAAYMPPEQRDNPAIQDVHMMKLCRHQPDHVWMQHHNGIFRSTDGGQTCSHLSNAPSHGFGFGVAVHPHDPNTAWFVPAVKDECRVPEQGAISVSRTRDGGVTFESLRQGLPQRDAYDLVYRHGLTIDETGNRLAMGSTTGGLWISDDQGDHWHAQNLRMPPIHAVQFA